MTEGSKAKPIEAPSPRPSLASCNQERLLVIKDGAMWFKPYQGQGPSSVALPQDNYRHLTSGDGSEAKRDLDRGFVMQDRLDNDHRVRAQTPSIGIGKHLEKSLSENVDSGVARIEEATGRARDKATAGSLEVGREFNDAKQNVPVTQNLGNQPDGRSAKQRLEKKPPEKTAAETGTGSATLLGVVAITLHGTVDKTLAQTRRQVQVLIVAGVGRTVR